MVEINKKVNGVFEKRICKKLQFLGERWRLGFVEGIINHQSNSEFCMESEVRIEKGFLYECLA